MRKFEKKIKFLCNVLKNIFKKKRSEACSQAAPGFFGG